MHLLCYSNFLFFSIFIFFLFGFIFKLDVFILNTEDRVLILDEQAGVMFLLLLLVNKYVHFSIKILFYSRIEFGFTVGLK